MIIANLKQVIFSHIKKNTEKIKHFGNNYK